MRRLRGYPLVIALGLLVVGIGLSVGLATWHAQQNDAIARQQLALRGTALAESLHLRVANFRNALLGLRGALAGDGDRAQRYRDFSSIVALQQEYPGALGFGYAERIPPKLLPGLLDRISRQHGRNIPLSTVSSNNGDRFVVVESTGEMALGTDLASLSLVREAGMRATWSADPVLSPPVPGNDGQPPSFYYLLPAYQAGVTPQTSMERADNVAGWLFVHLSGERLMSGIADQSLNFRLIDRDNEDNEFLVFDSEQHLGGRNGGEARGLLQEFEQKFGGRTWRFAVTPLLPFWVGLGQLPPQFTLATGIVLSALVAMLAYVLLTLRRSALALAEQMTTALRTSEERLRTILEYASVGIALSSGPRIVHCNPKFAEIFGWDSPEDLAGLAGSVVWRSDEDYHDVNRLAGPILSSGGVFGVERLMRRKDGSLFLADVLAKTISPGSSSGGTIWIAEDVTDKRAAELAIKESEQHLSQIVDGSSIATFVIDAEHRVTHWNRACAYLTGLNATQMLGSRDVWKAFYEVARPCLADLVADEATYDSIAELYPQFRRSRLMTGAFEAEHFFPQMGEGGRWLHFTAAPLRHGDGTHAGAIETLQDITEQRKAQAALEQLATRDGLTGIANRRSFDQQLSDEWNRSLRESLSLSLLMIDIDHFKRYNDTYGHQGGDQCLRQIAGSLDQVACRPGDLVARYGGEEFAVILTSTDTEGARVVARRILDRVAELAIPHSSGEEGYVTLSIGISTLTPLPGITPENLVSAADGALYQAKHAGRNRFVAT